ncbi:MAG: bacillithiol system redox-active protein YtxJ [Pyrinomonadaceae bacterium]
MANFIQITTSDELAAAFELSNTVPVALLKHSDSCGISAHVKYTLEALDADIHVVTVQLHRDLSDAIANRTGHRHQSPQMFVLRDEKVIHHSTHYGIDPDKVAPYLNAPK